MTHSFTEKLHSSALDELVSYTLSCNNGTIERGDSLATLVMDMSAAGARITEAFRWTAADAAFYSLTYKVREPVLLANNDSWVDGRATLTAVNSKPH